MPFGLGIWEIVILVGVLLLLFGAKGVPEVAKRLGTGMREVKDAVAEVDPRRMLDAGDDEKAKSAQKQAQKQAQKPTPKPPPASGDGPSTS
jgi:sec-independent protein translocase protein TatA